MADYLNKLLTMGDVEFELSDIAPISFSFLFLQKSKSIIFDIPSLLR